MVRAGAPQQQQAGATQQQQQQLQAAFQKKQDKWCVARSAPHQPGVLGGDTPGSPSKAAHERPPAGGLRAPGYGHLGT